LAVFSERLDAIRSIGRSDSDFFNRLTHSAKFKSEILQQEPALLLSRQL
jgi:hypothetical protein